MLPKKCSRCGYIFEAGPFEVVATCPRCGATARPDPKSGGPNLIKMLLPILGPVAAIIAYNLFGTLAMILVAWIALILFFKIK
ncbi:MAG: hypothetical protein GY797_30100 [Deltaproteobacteria bacterium]|nr:hypothetical protein [Deltaproteobacteria bacterium]